MNSSEKMLEALFQNARIRSRPILRSPTDSDSDSDSEDSKVVDLETVWAKLGLGKGKNHGLIEEANWYKKSLVDKTEAKPKPKAEGEGDGDDAATSTAEAEAEAEGEDKPKAEAVGKDKPKAEDEGDNEESMELNLFDSTGGASLLDAIQYEQNRLNSVNQMIGGKYY